MPSREFNNGQSNDQGHTASTVEEGILQLSSLLSQDPLDADADVMELLRRIDAADGVAQGVESKLDNILDHLDHLLASLEPSATEDNCLAGSAAKVDKDSQAKSW